ncbi:hypothetical protein TPHA_0D02810 [Tetrapisispora phaffii CBS 4417]|uniref:Protein AHC1 n=1 Tax=Tetrapisispora phaffii (strain ATCC 24235 / CBS 4417 / NBRC 1672 / NRRL Y-8282 / UCD 70-5) TaxID=1071381 RepID=G8BSU6_TETPH|nr:hypothetical protein TPHA_0D02810 [Tetrapisispora phaffii CBS 4417]CCE62917.1 hypothetical protein TPHA_0D02810 [Tetrapisispora phaffii CBS 4417]
MDRHNISHTLENTLELSDVNETDQPSPSQVLLMGSHEVTSRISTRVPSTGYYQVATPKSPHESTLENELQHLPDHDPCVISGDSEETERFKYVTAKKEIMNNIHLYSLVNNKEMQNIQLELERVNAKMTLLKEVHQDKKFIDNVEDYQTKDNERKKLELERLKNISSTFNEKESSILYSMNSNNHMSSHSNNVTHHYYQTRSKSQGNINELPLLRPANSTIMDMRLTGLKSIPNDISANESNTFDIYKTSPSLESLQDKQQQLNTHHKRNYSSTCLTSNSGLVGKTEDNEPIFKRYDGILVVISCSFCGRTGFSSAQGIVNHTRLKHSKTYSSQPLAVLHNQTLLESSKQKPKILEQFKSLGLDPAKDYLPNKVVLPNLERKNSSKNSNNNQLFTGINATKSNEISTKYLGMLYDDKEDFENLLSMVKKAPKDLEVFLKQTESESELSLQEDLSEIDVSKIEKEEEDDDEVTGIGDLENRSPDYTPSSVDNLSSSNSTPKPQENYLGSDSQIETDDRQKTPVELGRRLRKRKNDEDDVAPLKERLRASSNNMESEGIAVPEVPAHEKRSIHYNLRARSKLKSQHLELD